MARLVALRSALFSGARRRELASCWRQHKRHQNTETASTKSDRILETQFLGQMQFPKMTLPEFLWQDVGQWLSKPAVTCGSSGRSYTYGETRALCRRFANALLGAVGLRQGDVVGLLLPNIPEFVIAIHGAIEAGIIVTFANPLYTPDEIQRQFMNAGVRVSVTVPQLLPVMVQVGPAIVDYKCTIVVGEEAPQSKDGSVLSFQQLLSESLPADIPKASPDDVVLLPYSSGTTGLPKGVKLSHHNLVVNLQQLKHPDILLHTPTTETTQEVVLSVLPYFHIYGFNGILNSSLFYGMHIVSLPKFTPEDYIACVVKFKVMLGYLNNEEATQETIDPDGWLHTGDVAYYDEDEYFYIVDRTKELIKVKGNQVSPTELESIVLEIPGVADVAVVGIPDALAGELPRAFVVCHPDATNLTEAEVQQYVEPKVASYKKLAGGVKFIDVIPRNPAGKVLRQQLKVLGEKSPIQ